MWQHGWGWGLAALSRHWPEGRMQAEPQGPVPQRRLAALLQLSGGFFGAFFFGAMAGRAERYMTRATTASQGLGGPAGVRAAVVRYGEARQNGTTGTGATADTLRCGFASEEPTCFGGLKTHRGRIAFRGGFGSGAVLAGCNCHGRSERRTASAGSHRPQRAMGDRAERTRSQHGDVRLTSEGDEKGQHVGALHCRRGH